ncbi:ABC transporter permease [Carnobacterium sp. CS13]|uniref:ABC transporter permease n=1 Tax=Carnobacterium sp. CS13 TaxID=2800128 RepID=UPI001914B994|nr:ABC transporter permease [Carnobacterium sp. CS13]QQP70768.1 ABC transporter permease [Carnobacterium sp. CS13]
MKKYILKRLMIAVPVLFMVSIFSFVIINLAPGNPVDLYVAPDATAEQIEATKTALGLDQPLPVQYIKWITNLLQGNLGFSYSTRQPVAAILFSRVSPTLQLMGISLAVGYLVAIPLGIYSAVKKNTWVDYLITSNSFLGVSVPNFFLGLGLIYIFSLQLAWLPTGGMQVLGGDGGVLERIQHLVLPVIVLATSISGNMIRYVRSSMIDVLGENYLRTATAKGLKARDILTKHGLRNALIPIITIIGMDIPKLIGGAVVTEQIFQWPGLGQLMITSINSRDYPVLMAITLLSAVAVMAANISTDILYAVVDPRIKYD